MKILLVIVLVAVCMCSPRAEAIIGFSKERCDKAYGVTPATKKSGGFEVAVYENVRASTVCFFFEGECVGILIKNLGMTKKQAAFVLTLSLAKGEAVSDLKRIDEIKGRVVYGTPSGRSVIYAGNLTTVATPTYHKVRAISEAYNLYEPGKPNPYKIGSYHYNAWKTMEDRNMKSE